MTAQSFLIALVASTVGVPLVRVIAVRIRLVDVPNDRSSHESLVPRGAGIAVTLAVLLAMFVAADAWTQAATGLVIGSFLLASLGLSDDIHSLTAHFRLAAQIAIVAVSVPLLLMNFTGPTWWLIVVGIGTVCWCLAYVNAFNFMDGINGMSVAQATVAGLAIALMGHRWHVSLLTIAGMAIAGAAIGFAPFNVPRARIFLGDVGAYFLGFWLAALLVIELRAGVPTEVAIAPYLLYLGDTGTTIVRRIRRRENLRFGHRQHAYQRLTDHGWSHPAVSLLAGAVIAFSTLVMTALDHSAAPLRACGFGVALAPVIAFVLLPSVLSRRAQIDAT